MENVKENEMFSLKVGIVTYMIVVISVFSDIIGILIKNQDLLKKMSASFAFMVLIVFVILLNLKKSLKSHHWGRIIDLSTVIAIPVYAIEKIVLAFKTAGVSEIIFLLILILTPVILYFSLSINEHKNTK